MKMRFRTSCVNSTGQAIRDMVDRATDITRKTFLRHVDRAERLCIERDLGYSQFRDGGLQMANDFHVSYHKSIYLGRKCYYFCHSAIEYIFT